MADSPHAIRVSLNRRAREVGIFDQELSMEDLAGVRAFYNFTCLNCGKKPATSIDHVKALKEGGQNTLDNLQLLCTQCNRAKGKKEEDYRKGQIVTAEFVAQNTDSSYVDEEVENNSVSTNSRDWEPIRIEYIQGQMSLRDLSAKQGVSYAAIKYHADKEEWTKQRGEYRISVSTELAEKLREQHIDAKTTAARVAYDVISSWLSPAGEPASASDALNAAKLLLLAEGEATDRLEIHRQMVEKVIKGHELEQTGTTESGEPASNWLRTLAATGSDTFVA